MTTITFTTEVKAQIVTEIKAYFLENMDQDIGGFDAEFLFDFFTQKIGPRYYNQALSDVSELIEQQRDNLMDAVYELEKSEI